MDVFTQLYLFYNYTITVSCVGLLIVFENDRFVFKNDPLFLNF